MNLSPVGSNGLLLAGGVAAVALVLLVSQAVAWGRGRGRSAEPGVGRRAVRRTVATLVMLLCGLGIAWGSVTPPAVNGRPGQAFVTAWAGVSLLVLVLLGLALVDLLETRRAALHHREWMNREGLSLLREYVRLRRRARSGPSNGSPPPEDPA